MTACLSDINLLLDDLPQVRALPKVFVPHEETSLEALGIPQHIIEKQILKYLLNAGDVTGRQIACQLKLSGSLVTGLLRQMKSEMLVSYKQASGPSDYEFILTERGHTIAQRAYERSTYFGTVPVTLEEYLFSVKAQSPGRERPTAEKLRNALGELKISPKMFQRLGQAMISVGAMFLYGSPGNGKTSIAERLTETFSPSIWIPRTLFIEGEIVRLFDPTVHEEIIIEDDIATQQQIDQRWVKIKRPTVIVGGELKMEHLELKIDHATGVLEAPFQLKSNCGTLVIDDFGRQQMSTDELLNRWIIPLEKKYDFLNTPSGKKVQVPFEQMIVFATNLEPKELVDEAFLRRIPYKIQATDPTEEDFHDLFYQLATQMEIAGSTEIIDYLIEKHFKEEHRPMRYCHVRDLLLQVNSYCHFLEQQPQLTRESVDAAVANYFSIM
ncbi:Predicted ATPase with chaperone activity, associated with Flp pilus assembly [hydrothermal vent metagenome]|uniref:Predicted ATPase with chaperone activity, associated with Flp pilus assembly n=1 Tax=hydrothermal vent metagenome TaxID=652676 RepID=A0A3B1E8Y2_9ZZZZ